jgi:putative zinc finger/helix-turn-helix YgiT family protein
MNCVICGETAKETKEVRRAQYRDEAVEVEREFFRCEFCKEEFVAPKQMAANVRAVKNEVRRKYGLLSPERIVEIRSKLELTQVELEELLCTGRKVVVRWESGKVIQNGGQDNMLRLLERDPSIVKSLRQIQQLRREERNQYAPKAAHQARTKVACAV